MFALVAPLFPGVEAATTRTFVFELGNEQLTSEASAGVVVVSLSKPHRSKTVTVDYVMSPVSATPVDDYEVAAGTLRFKPGKRTKTIPIAIPDDSEPEQAETFEVVLSNPRRAILPPDPSVTVTIQRDAPASGELIMNELQIAPSGADKEYVEISNVGPVGLDLRGVTFADTSSSCEIGDRSLSAGGRVVLGGDADVADVLCATFPSLTDGGDALDVWSGAPDVSTILDSFAYPNGFAVSGRSASLDPDSMTAAGNDLTSAWCPTPNDGSFSYDGSNHGTPGAANPHCP